LELLAAATRIKKIGVIMPDKRRLQFRRWQVLGAAASFIMASAKCVSSIRRCQRELTRLGQEEIVPPMVSSVKRVAYLNANLWFGVKAGGSVGHISGVINGLLKEGYDVDFFSAGSRLMVSPQSRYCQLEPPAGYGLPFDGNYYSFSLDVADKVSAALDEQKCAFIYQRMSVANYSGVILSRKQRLPLVLEYNGSEVWIASKWGRPLSHPDIAEKAEEVCLRHAHALVTVSDVLRDELIDRGVPPEKIISYPNCIDQEMFNPDKFLPKDVAEVRARYGLSPDSIVISFLGTFGQWHGVEVMGEAIRLLASTQRDFLERRKVHFLIIGDGVRMSGLRQILSDPACAGLYTLPGLINQEEAPLHLVAADILLSPHVGNVDATRFFGSPTKLFEYMAMAKAIVASDLDQIGEVLKNSLHSEQLPSVSPGGAEDRLAVLSPPGDARLLADAIKFLINSYEWRQVLGQNARREALKRYTWQHHVRAIEDRLMKLSLINFAPHR
jgi:glycosyltransferase involved in cell wall biosynthesis